MTVAVALDFNIDPHLPLRDLNGLEREENKTTGDPHTTTIVNSSSPCQPVPVTPGSSEPELDM